MTLQEDRDIIKKDPAILIFIIFGIFLIIAGGTALNAVTPNPQIGFPLVALGFAFAAYGLNKFSSLESGKKIDEILEKLDKNIENNDENEDTSPINEFDPNINKLMQVINSYPEIQTLMSCGGHKNPRITHSQVPENEFYIDFGFKSSYPTKEAWQSLNEISRSIYDDSIYEWYFSPKSALKIEIRKDESHIVYFRLRGYNVEPNSIAAAMLERQPENFETLQVEIPRNSS
jgi:hypothetical protein